MKLFNVKLVVHRQSYKLLLYCAEANVRLDVTRP